MARSSLNSKRNRNGRRFNSILLASAVVVFVLVVFLMFRGGSPGPQEAAAGNEPADARPAAESGRAAPQLAVVETNRPATVTPQMQVPSQPEPTAVVVQNAPIE
ncbi:MAG: hypothetical protein JW741_04065, partial [Sedimentisphaerales bacterium]|nr:hypothetical protein [Sedimentisphaerales bacterium]